MILELVACIAFSLNPKIAVCCQTKEITITKACQDQLQGGWLNLQIVLCETDCELEFMNPLYSSDMTDIYYSLKKTSRKIEICHQKLYVLPLQQSIRSNINLHILCFILEIKYLYKKNVKVDINFFQGSA